MKPESEEDEAHRVLEPGAGGATFGEHYWDDDGARRHIRSWMFPYRCVMSDVGGISRSYYLVGVIWATSFCSSIMLFELS